MADRGAVFHTFGCIPVPNCPTVRGPGKCGLVMCPGKGGNDVG